MTATTATTEPTTTGHSWSEHGPTIEHRTLTRTEAFASDHAYWQGIAACIDGFTADCVRIARAEQHDAWDSDPMAMPERISMHIHVESSGPDENDDGRPRCHMTMRWDIVRSEDPKPRTRGGTA